MGRSVPGRVRPARAVRAANWDRPCRTGAGSEAGNEASSGASRVLISASFMRRSGRGTGAGRHGTLALPSSEKPASYQNVPARYRENPHPGVIRHFLLRRMGHKAFILRRHNAGAATRADDAPLPGCPAGPPSS
ncbi:hypothetical protein CBM2626_B150073 [Cupriavidus taiwanensis]|nr:hypothetical protein CBM2626_B150073 [Cupriavidus taiwanensis]